MAVLRKQSFPENLETFAVLVTDTSENSSYFKITDLPDTFTGGKNSFLIQGSEDLVQDTIVKVEIKDSNGNIIYTEPGEGIPEYYEGTSKPVAVYVYPDTAYGPCTITILGELAEYINERGVKTGVPAEWRNKYNVRWQKVINVNPNLTNTSKIRFYRRPKVKITETVLPIYNRTVSRVTISGSLGGSAIQPSAGSNFRTFRGDTIYYLYATSSVFSSSMEGENITITGLPQSYTTTVKDVVNSSRVLVTTPYYETSSNLPTSYQTITNFNNGNFTLTYNSNVELSGSTLNASYAKIRLTDLEAFSGDPARLKVFSKRKADIGNYSLIEDVRLESSEIFITDAYSGSVSVSTGQFINQSIINDFWYYSDINGNNYSATYDNSLLAASVKLVDDNTKNNSSTPQRILYYKTNIDFSKDTEYEIDFIPILSSSTFLPAKLEVYGSGSAFSNTDIINSLGKRISSYEFDAPNRRYDRQQILFKPDSDGTGTIVFAIQQGNWQISNISLRASSETNFSPNEITLNVEVPTVVKNDEYEFRFEFYDVNNNFVPVTVVTSSVFTGGSTLEDVNVTARFFQVSPDSNVFPFGYLNNYDFQELNTFASVPIGSDSILFNIQAAGLTGSPTFASAAYDSGGVYIDPATYVGQYPGFLTNITTSSAILEVGNFTGSMASTIEVRRIEYTASWEEFSDIVSIYKVVEGTPGSDGENGEQYIIKPINGTAIKNSNPSVGLEVQLVKIFGNAALDIIAGDVKLVTGSLNTVITAGNGIVAGTNGLPYNAIFYADKINGLLEVKAYDFFNNRIVDTISLADVTDGLTTGFVEGSNGLILNRDPNTNTYTPSETALTASFYDSVGQLYTESILITPSYSPPNDRLTYQMGINSPNINLDYVKTVAGVTMSDGSPSNTTGLTARFTFTEPNTNQQISVSEGVVITRNGSSGTAGAAGTSGTAGSNGTSGIATPVISISPASQIVNVTTAGVYGIPVNISASVIQEATSYTYDDSSPYGNSTFRITNIQSGSNNNDGTITLIQPTTTAGYRATFDVTYVTSTGLTSSPIPQSHVVSVALTGSSGPGVVFTGVWESGRAYQYENTRRDVVLYSTTGNEPYDTYYATKIQHTADNSNKPPNTTYWESLGTEDFFVAAKIAIFEESFIKNTLNIGSSNNGGISSANITLAGSGSYPYISLGQSDVIGSQGYGLPGIFLGAVKDTLDSDKRKYRFSLVSGSNFLRWDGTGKLEVSGTISASEGQIGGVTLNGDKMYIGAGVWNNPNTAFYVDKNGYFSLEDRLVWDGLNNHLNISGTIKAETGSFGGITIGANKIYTGPGVFGGSTTGFYADNTGQFSLKDKLTWNNNSLFVSGAVSASEGRIGPVNITYDRMYIGTGDYNNSNTAFFISSSGDFSLKNSVQWQESAGLFSINSGSISIRGVGSTVINSTGLTAANANITGTITATQGVIGRWFIVGDSLFASSSTATIYIKPNRPSIEIYNSGDLKVDISGDAALSGTSSIAISLVTNAAGTTGQTVVDTGNISSNYDGTYVATFTSASLGTQFITGSFTSSFVVPASANNSLITINFSNITSEGNKSASFSAEVDNTSYYISSGLFTLRYGFLLCRTQTGFSPPFTILDSVYRTGTSAPSISSNIISASINYSGNLTLSTTLTAASYSVFPFIQAIEASATANDLAPGCNCPDYGTLYQSGECVEGPPGTFTQTNIYYDGTCTGVTCNTYSQTTPCF